MINIKKAGSAILNMICIFLFIYLLANPSAAEEGTKNGINFCITVIIPSLFIFMVLSQMIFPWLLRATRGRNIPFSVLVIGALCGFPVGAKLTTGLLNENKITKKQAEYINSFSNNASVSFLLSFAGANVLGDIKYGVYIFILQLACSAICAFLLKYLILDSSERQISIEINSIKNISFVNAVKSSAVAMVNICACIIVFICIGEIINSFVPMNDTVKAVVKGFFEFSGGIEACRGMGITTAFPFICMITGWSGMSVHMQVKSVCSGSISIKYYIIVKIISSALMGVAGGIIINIIK